MYRTMKAMIKLRSATEPTIGYMKMDGRLARSKRAANLAFTHKFFC